MRYQFQVDNQPVGPVRDEVIDAFHDAVAYGYATWENGQRCAIQLDLARGASIKHKMEPPVGAAPTSSP